MLITDFGIVIYGGLIGDATQSLINKKIDNAVKLLVLYFIIVIVNNLLNRFLNNIGFLGSNEKNYKNGSVYVYLDSFDWNSFVSCKNDFCKKPLY